MLNVEVTKMWLWSTFPDTSSSEERKKKLYHYEVNFFAR